MAEIRVERKGGSHTWLWVLVAVVVLIVAVLLLDRAGYIQLPRFGVAPAQADSPAQLAPGTLRIQEV